MKKLDKTNLYNLLNHIDKNGLYECSNCPLQQKCNELDKLSYSCHDWSFCEMLQLTENYK